MAFYVVVTVGTARLPKLEPQVSHVSGWTAAFDVGKLAAVELSLQVTFTPEVSAERDGSFFGSNIG